MSGGTITRREAVRRLGWIAVAVASGHGLPRRSEAQASKPPLEGLAGLLAHPRSAGAVGVAFLAAHPAEADLEALVRQLGLSMDALPTPGSPELEATARAIHALHIEDFREGRLAQIEGWSLSLTELRLAAVAHLASRE